MAKFKFIKYISLAIIAGFITISCSDDDDPKTDPEPTEKVTYLVIAGDAATDLSGGNYMLTLDNLNSGKDTTIYNNTNALYSADVFTQIANNATSKTLTGFIYGRGSTTKAACLKSYELVNGQMQEVGERVDLSTFGNTGTLGAYSYAAGVSNGTVTIVSRTGSIISKDDKLIDLTQYAIDGTSPTITGISDMGNNQAVIAFNYANADKAVVAFVDYAMNVSKTVADDRIGASGGAWRSVRYSQIEADESGNIYVFSGAGSKSGALRINKGESVFDTSYSFDILAASGGYRFRKVFPISDDYFLLDFYSSTTAYGNMDNSGKYAIVKMSDKSFKWVSGLPATDNIDSNGWPAAKDGVIYLPINPVTGKPTVYAINAATGVATVGLTIGDSELLKAVTFFTE